MKKIIIAIFALCILNSCDKESLDLSSDEFNSSELKSSVDPKTDGVTVPFKSSFSTKPGIMDNPVFCDEELGLGLVIQVGGGVATHLGRFTTEMSFCVDENFFYFGVEGKFYAANGDELWISVPSGQVIPNPELPEPYVFYFTDDFFFVGGTGRFVGATGKGTTNSFVEADLATDHEWNGTITLLKSK